jgi:vacuolar protein sorting-associated protein 13A/C
MSQDCDPEVEEMQRQEEKQQRLKQAEDQLLEASRDDSAGYFNSIWTAVVDNIQITMRNIHVRYEDVTSCPDVISLSLIQRNHLELALLYMNWLLFPRI